MNSIKINSFFSPKYTPAGEKAFNNIKKSIKKEVITFNDIIPKPSKELTEKKGYMKTDEFWNDPHNKKMSTLTEKLIEARDNIAKKIAENNKTNKEPLAQGTNGFTRIKKYLDINPKMNFMKTPTFYTKDDVTIMHTNTKIYNLAREEKIKLGK